MTDAEHRDTPLTIYDVARHAGVSIASVSRVLNGRGSPRPETRDRVMQAVYELGFVPDGAARALSNRLKEVVGVVFRRGPDDIVFDIEDHLMFVDILNRGIEIAAQRHSYDVLMSSVAFHEPGVATRLSSLASKSDALILHDRVLSSNGIVRLAQRVPVVTLAGTSTPVTANVRSNNQAGIRALARHLLVDHEYRSLAYLAGHADSPDNLIRAKALRSEVRRIGGELWTGAAWEGDYSTHGGARVIRTLLESGGRLPRVIVCANDQTAIGVMRALSEFGIDVPGEVAVTGFDDLAAGRYQRPKLTTVRQPVSKLGETAFEVAHALIGGRRQAGDEVVLPTELIIRESCGCEPDTDQAPVGAFDRATVNTIGASTS